MIEGKIRKELRPEDVTVVIDNREQNPLNIAPMKAVSGTLATGDYTVLGLEHLISIERKDLQDLIGCIGRERERFEREMHRILAYPCRALIIEAQWSQIEMHTYRGQVEPNAVMGSLMGWIARGVPVVLIGDHARASKWVSRMLFLAAKHRWNENYPFLEKMVS